MPKKPSSILISGFSDPVNWKDEWLLRAFEKIRKYPQHDFLVLTKNPEIYERNICWQDIPENVFIGATTLNEEQISHAQECFTSLPDNKNFLSIEPLQKEIDPVCIDNNIIDLVIVGGLSGPGVQPKTEWLEEFQDYSWIWYDQDCLGDNKGHCCYFEKKNLEKISRIQLKQELPWKMSTK